MNKQIKSVIILIENIENNIKKYTRKSYAEKLAEEDLPYSPSSITRILNYLKNELGITISFPKNGVCEIIENESDPNYIEKIQIYKSLYFRSNLQKLILENQPFSEYIYFGFDTQNKNIEYIQSILNAITFRRKIQFTYKSFQENTEKIYLTSPLFLKEYLNRWYLIAETNKSPNRVFAIDRIINITFLNKKFKSEHKFNDLYKDTIGINFSGETERVLLWVSKKQYPYFKTLPIHKSQKLIEKTKNGFKISLDVVVNYELERWILYYGNSIQVIEPKPLKDKIKKELQETLNLYKK